MIMFPSIREDYELSFAGDIAMNIFFILVQNVD